MDINKLLSPPPSDDILNSLSANWICFRVIHFKLPSRTLSPPNLFQKSVDAITLPYAKIATCLWNRNCIILPGISIFGINSPLLNARDLRNPWSYVSCKGVRITIVSDHLDNAGFNAIAKSSLSIRIKHLSKWDVTASMSSLRFAVFSLVCDCIQMCVLFVMTALQSSPVWCYFWKWLRV